MTSPHDAYGLSKPQRLAALRDSGLLRHDPQARLDVLCETATLILRAPMSQVNVLDDKYQTSIGKWPPGGTRVTPVDDTACKSVVRDSNPVIVPNTLLHPVLCMIPAVTVLGARSYLGVPIFYNSEVIGTFCVADYVVRDWTAWDVAGLQGLARLAGLAVSPDE